MRGFTIAKVMHTIRLGLANARSTPTIKAAIRSFGYDENRMKEGDDLYREVVAFRFAYEVKRDDMLRAHEAWKDQGAEARKVYIQHLKFARRAFADCRSRWGSLEMKGRRKGSFLGWTGQAQRFYHGILANEELLSGMSRFKVTVENLEQALASVEEAVAGSRVLARLETESIRARVEWDQCLSRLKEWYYMFRFILRTALEHIPEFFIAVGLRSKRKPGKNRVYPLVEPFGLPLPPCLPISPHS